MVITNAKALSFNVGVTNIEEVGTDSLGSVTKIDIPDREVDVLFEEIGAEASFSLTITNTGDRAGTLKEITITPENDKIEYTTNLPEGGLAINGNDTNVVTITAEVKEGAVNGKSSTELKIKYTYDEGSCPDGEILSADESMCLCPEGYERNEKGICVKPEKEEKIECKDDEIYNESKKICEKKVIPVPDKVVPSNPKTLDNIVLITLLFIVSGLGIYAVMYKKLNTTKKKVTVAVITGVTTFAVSFTVLAGVFGLDNLLGAIVNPITKNKELKITVYEEIDLIETWDGNCDLEVGELTPGNIFDGGSGTEADPYRVKTANQLACLAKSVNNGTTYEGKYIKQTKTIKLNDNLNAQVKANDLSNAHVWTSAGYTGYGSDTNWERVKVGFHGTYDGNNKTISGLYLTDESTPQIGSEYYIYRGMFGFTKNATFKNMILTDIYFNTTSNTGSLIGYAYENLTLDNITTYGNGTISSTSQYGTAGIVSNFNGNNVGNLVIENTTNNMNLTCSDDCSGVISRIESVNAAKENPNLIFRNVTNKGKIRFTDFPLGSGGIGGYIYASTGNLLAENCVNKGNIEFDEGVSGDSVAGLFGYVSMYQGKFVVKDSYNEGDITGFNVIQGPAGLAGYTYVVDIDIDNCYNSGDFIANVTSPDYHSYGGGLLANATYRSGDEKFRVTNSYNTGDIISPNNQFIGGIVGKYEDYSFSDKRVIENCYNTGKISASYGNGGIAGQYGGIIRNSYNTGDITSDNNNVSGIIGYGGNSKIYNTYNTGDITLDHSGSYAAGICSSGCLIISNCYNTGDVTVLHGNASVGGISGQQTIAVNVYNTGKLSCPNAATAPYVSGIVGDGGRTVANAYNVGDIYIETTTASGGELQPSGITSSGSVLNSVNVGSITLKIDVPYTEYYANVYLSGITKNGTVKNSYNAGRLIVDDSTAQGWLDQEISMWGSIYKNSLYIGEIKAYDSTSTTSSGNKFNNENGKALGCVDGINAETCSIELSETVGTYTTEAVPDMLSIINSNNNKDICEAVGRDSYNWDHTCVYNEASDSCEYANPQHYQEALANGGSSKGYMCQDLNLSASEFELLDGASLPTLKVFNQ
jgi:hypothetical protein